MNSFSESLTKHIKGSVLPGESLKRHTTWRIGGPAEVLVMPAGKEDVVAAIRQAGEWGKDVTIIGNGSNLLVSDTGVSGLVLKLGGAFNRYSLQGDRLVAESGCLLPGLSRQTVEAGFSGLEFGGGIPASLGGALVMNAGAHGEEIANLVEEVQACTLRGEPVGLTKDECGFRYRQSIFQQGGLVILEAVLKLRPGNREESRALLKRNLAKRSASQPLDIPNAGSVFRNPPQGPAALFIDLCGAKGLRIGGAEVSTKHANFIVNTGNATAADVLALIKLIREMVLEKFQIELHPEIKTLGCSRD